jgi:GNAT superfamily N-acetyltransferase
VIGQTAGVLGDETLADLGRRNLIEFCRELARWSGPRGAIEERDGLVFYATASSFPVLMNGVFRVDPAVPGPEVVAAADDWFGVRGSGYSLRIGPSDDDLVAAAEADGGFMVMDGGPEMVIRAPVEAGRGRGLPAGAELRWLQDEPGVQDFLAVSGAAYSTYGMPPEVFGEAVLDVDAFLAPHIHSVVAYVDGQAAAAAQTILSHGIAGVYCVGTVESARGRGLGEAVTTAVTNRAFELGAPVNTLQASTMGEPIYRRMGYEEIARDRSCVRFSPPTD